jgi:hypothetical protein
MKRVLFAAVCVVSSERTLLAEDSAIDSFNPQAAVAPISIVEGPGIRVGEGTVLHPAFGIETGVVSNVFYEEDAPNSTGVLRLMAQIGTGSLSDQRLKLAPTADEGAESEVNQGKLRYRASLRLSYDVMLSGNETVRDTGGLGIGASLHGVANPQGRWAFSFDDDFERLIRATNFETDANTNRDINNLRLAVLYKPTDRALNGSLYYTNMIDVFERSEQEFADRIDHRVGLRVMWRWLPKTQLYADTSIGYIDGLGDSVKVSSTPLVAKAGLATLLTVKTTLNVEGGYTNGFYASGPSYSAPLVNAQVAYRFSPTGRVGLIYNYLHQDSINANYFRDHVIRFWLRQGFVPFVFMVQPEVHFRRYNGIQIVEGPPERDDVILAVTAGLNYAFRDWIAATVNYRFSSVQTEYMYMVNGIVDDPSFVRHELLAGLRVAL